MRDPDRAPTVETSPGVAPYRFPWRERIRACGWAILVTLAYLVATTIMTWPYAMHMAEMVPRHFDPPFQIWVMRWVQHALATDPTHLYSANIFYPLENTLAYSDANIPVALIGAPLWALTDNPILTYNTLVLGSFILAGTGMYTLVGALTANRAVGFLAGLAYAFLPYRFAHIIHLNQLGHAWTPWVLLALLLLLTRPRWYHAIALGVLLAVETLSSFYLGFQLVLVIGLALAVAFVAAPRTRHWSTIGLLLLAGILALALVVPLALPYLQVRDVQGLQRSREEITANNWMANPRAYLTTTRQNLAWSWAGEERRNGENSLFPGGLALLGAGVGVIVGVRRRRAVTVALLLIGTAALIISLGPTRPGGVPLPYGFLYDHAPFFTAMRVPARFGVQVDLAIVILAGLGAAALWTRLRARLRPTQAARLGAALTVGLAILLLAELFAAPIGLGRLDDDPALIAANRWLAEQADEGAVMHFPPSTDDPVARAKQVYWSSLNWHPIVYGYSGFEPDTARAYLAAFSHDLPRPDGSVAKQVGFVDSSTVGLLRDAGVRYLLLHRDGYKREDWPIILAELEKTGVAEPAADFGGIVAYRLDLADPPPVGATVFAPTLVAPGHDWQPALIFENPNSRPALLSRQAFRPTRLAVRWRDEQGREVRVDNQPFDLPLIMPADRSVVQFRPGQPTIPGRYTVSLAITGAIALRQSFAVVVSDTPPVPASDGPPLALANVTLGATELVPGDTLQLELDWNVRATPPEDYTIFVQMIGEDGRVWGQHDAPAGWEGHGTSAWLPGERVSLPWAVAMQPDAPSGRYRLLLGMYRHTASGVERVPLRYPDGDTTEYEIGEIVAP